MPPVIIRIKQAGTQKKPLVIAIGKKISKKATERNLLKRRIKAIMQPIIKGSGHDFIITVKPEAINLTYRELKKELERKVPT